MACALLSLALLGALVRYALPTGDDFCYASLRPSDALPYVARMYLTQTGRWSYTAIETFLAVAIPDIVRAYPWVLAALLAIRIPCAYAFARAILHPGLTRLQCFAAAASFCLFYWCAMPSLGDSLYWMTGALNYELAASGLLLFLAVLWRGPLTGPRAAALSLAAILLAGMHEVVTLVLLALVAAGCALAFLRRSPGRRWWLLLLAATTAGALIVFLAPGNYARAHDTSDSAGLLRVFTRAAYITFGRAAQWIFDLPLLLAAFAALASPSLQLKPAWTGPYWRTRFMLAAAVGGASIAAGFLIASGATGGVTPGRLLNWQYLVFLAALLAMLLLLKPAIRFPAWVSPWATAAAFVAMAAIGNPRLAAIDLAQRVPQWSHARRQALSTLASRGVFPALPQAPHMYFNFDVGSNPAAYPNVCTARYYRLPSVVGPGRGDANGAAFSGRLFH